ncbi:MAG: nucleoside hydrolase [Chloroflexi bacterium]|nr:nucleoside hydrolase [Chloroflexota bacterium]
MAAGAAGDAAGDAAPSAAATAAATAAASRAPSAALTAAGDTAASRTPSVALPLALGLDATAAATAAASRAPSVALPLALGLDVTAAASRTPSVALPLALGLDVTERARFLPEHVAGLAAAAGCDGAAAESRVRTADVTPPDNAVLRYVTDSLRFYMQFHARYDGFYGAFIHDPFVVAVALDESLVRAEPVTVDVETAGEIASAQTIADWRHLWGRPPNAMVGIEACADTFLERLIDRVGRLARDRG